VTTSTGFCHLPFFLFMILFMWGVLLLGFKCLGHERVGCAAGGSILDVEEMRHDPILKPRLRAIIQRSWRIQVAFFLTAFLIPIASGFFLVKGLQTVNKALLEIQNINEDIESVVFRAIDVTNSLIKARSNIARTDIHAIANIEGFCTGNSTIFANASIPSNLGPNNTSNDVKLAFKDLDVFLDVDLSGATRALNNIVSVTQSVDDSVSFVFKNDWLLKMFILCLNVIVGFFFVAICLSKSNFVHYPFHAMLAYMLVPVFCIQVVLASLSTISFGIATVANADFCAGGDFPGSPRGTMQDVVRLHNMSKHDPIFDSFQYYVGDCMTENPLHFIQPYQAQLQSIVGVATTFLKTVDDFGVDSVSKECGTNVKPVVTAVQYLLENLDIIQGNVASALTLSDCSTIAPILRRILIGDSCANATTGLTWMFSSLLAVSLLGMTLLSLRAALYNATIQAPTKERTDKWEWQEYKEYMASFYNDALQWKFYASPHKQGDLANAQSFETCITTRPSLDTEDYEDEPEYSNDDHGRWVLQDEALMLNNDGSFSEASTYTTPVKFAQRPTTALEEIEAAIRTRGFYADVIDTEIQPLEPMMVLNVRGKTPQAPRKLLKSIQRTSLGLLADSKIVNRKHNLV